MIELYACQHCEREQPVTSDQIALTCEFCGSTQVVLRKQPSSDTFVYPTLSVEDLAYRRSLGYRDDLW